MDPPSPPASRVLRPASCVPCPVSCILLACAAFSIKEVVVRTGWTIDPAGPTALKRVTPVSLGDEAPVDAIKQLLLISQQIRYR